MLATCFCRYDSYEACDSRAILSERDLYRSGYDYGELDPEMEMAYEGQYDAYRDQFRMRGSDTFGPRAQGWARDSRSGRPMASGYGRMWEDPMGARGQCMPGASRLPSLFSQNIIPEYSMFQGMRGGGAFPGGSRFGFGFGNGMKQMRRTWKTWTTADFRVSGGGHPSWPLPGWSKERGAACPDPAPAFQPRPRRRRESSAAVPMSQTAKPPGRTAQTTVIQTMVSWALGCHSLPSILWGSRAELVSLCFSDEGTEGEAAEGTEGAEAVEKGSRAVSGCALCTVSRWGLCGVGWLSLCHRAGLSMGATGHPGHARVNSTRERSGGERRGCRQAIQPEAGLLLSENGKMSPLVQGLLRGCEAFGLVPGVSGLVI